MKMVGLAALLLLGVSVPAHAIPVTYSFTSTWAFEADAGGIPSTPTGPGSDLDFIFSPADTFVGTFVYDSETAPLGSFPSAIVYGTTVTDIAGTIGEHDILAPTASASILRPPRFLSFGGSATGLSIGNWTSRSLSLVWLNFTGLTLPDTLPPADVGSATLSVNFTNTQTNVQRQVAFGSLVITQVPEPRSELLALLAAVLFGGYVMRNRTMSGSK